MIYILVIIASKVLKWYLVGWDYFIHENARGSVSIDDLRSQFRFGLDRYSFLDMIEEVVQPTACYLNLKNGLKTFKGHSNST